MNTKVVVTLDLRPLDCSERHGLVFQTWGVMAEGESFSITNDHDPVPLRSQFERLYSDAFSWEYLEKGPDVFRVRIRRLALTDDLKPVCLCGPEESRSELQKDRSVDLDLRGFEPPQPMVAILEAFEALGGGKTLCALLDRNPIHLLPELEAREASYRCEERSDGAWVLMVLKQA